MPALKMKTKSTADSLKGKGGPHVCQMSCTITKNSLSRPRVFQNAEVCTLYNQDATDDKIHALNHGGDAHRDESHNEANLSQKHPSTLTDSTTAGNVEPTLSTCTSSFQTNFPPILSFMDFCNNEGNGSLYVPQLDTDESDGGSRSLSEYQACNVSDFYISDMIFSTPSTRCNSEFESKTEMFILPDYKCEESSFLCDLTEECMVLPFLEDTLDTRSEISDRPSEEKGDDADSFSMFTALRQLRPHNEDSSGNAYFDKDYESFDLQMYIRNPLDQLDISFTSSTPMPNEKQCTKQVTLVLDLDETLVHSTLDHCDDSDFTFPVFFDMKEHVVYVRKRPHLQTFLRRVAEMFEVVVFTASQSIYAGHLLDILDPEGNIISRRAYRESCIFLQGIYVKDLTVLGVDLAKVAIIDNTPQVFQLQVNNGIPIKSWFDDPSDSALISLLPFLETLVDADDVRPIIARKFGNKE